MTVSKTCLALLLLLLAVATMATAADPQPAAVALRIVTIDPSPEAHLVSGERLYLKISYESPVPVRFLAETIRQGERQTSSATNSAPPYNAGHGEALAWVAMSTPVRVDEIRVTAYDLEWREIGSTSTHAVVIWEYQEHHTPREPADWVGPMQKQHRRVFDTAYDPFPERPQPLFDIFFIISFAAIPLYLLMQAQMLIRYRGQWQWYAAAPLLPLVPLALYSLIGLGLSRALWIKFLFHYMAAALIYLLILWTVKRDRDKMLRKKIDQPQVDASSGME